MPSNILPSRHACALALCLALFSLPTTAFADAEWGWSPGIKLGWTFGQGLTYGLEVSFIRLPNLTWDKNQSLLDVALDMFGQVITETWGIVVNLDTNFRGMFKMRAGVEWCGPGLGLEAGPALVVTKEEGTHLGLGITPWIGYQVFGYYTFTWVFGRARNLHEIGAYLKAPLLSFEGKSTYSDDWDDD